jgi:hypothetical protein
METVSEPQRCYMGAAALRTGGMGNRKECVMLDPRFSTTDSLVWGETYDGCLAEE